jgi:hypothetical protein
MSRDTVLGASAVPEKVDCHRQSLAGQRASGGFSILQTQKQSYIRRCRSSKRKHEIVMGRVTELQRSHERQLAHVPPIAGPREGR